VDAHARTLRRRLDALEAASDPGPDVGPESGLAKVVRTVSGGAYPTSAGSCFAVREVIPGGAEAEGAAVTGALTGPAFFAQNRGSAVPPAGTDLVATLVRGRWQISWTG
jgi:hypothetical protein